MINIYLIVILKVNDQKPFENLSNRGVTQSW